MPDFEKFKLGAPVKAQYRFRGDDRHAEVDGHFDVVVPSISKSETNLVAKLARKDKALEYRQIEGRLFRPFFEFDTPFWTLHDLRNVKPPTVQGLPLRGMNLHRETPLMGSPWLHWEPSGNDATDAARTLVRKLAPQAWEAVESRLQGAAASGLRLVDGMLFQETRSPAFGVNPSEPMIKPMMPDGRDVHFSVLVNPRLSTRDLSAVAWRAEKRLDCGSLQILEPSLLPDTVPRDAVAAFAM